ncbi:hypothetical protein [Paludibacter jiangxiensis]|uniref:Uncharacterized protein n=1 Tax=Paludibacter jiangxiensis TaxID=681398 RepID=A0A171A8J9_9BACT|nr:hypothetical protein [Paludibacter jiangxiensis]GAT63392.1 hypothetical protein PJIAN_3721 [Paludibacter jiangxiensis]
MIASHIMNCLLAQKMIVWSWGFNSPIYLRDGLQFNVQGFIFQGVVQIKYNEGTDLFYINFIKNKKILDVFLNVSIDMLIDTLDCYIEKVEDYGKRVRDEYSLL